MTYQNDIHHANKCLQQRNYKRSLKAAISAAKKSPRSAMAPNIAGIATCAMGQTNEAIKYFQKALKLQPDFPDAKRNLAQTLILVGGNAQALLLLEKFACETPDDWKIWFLKAQAEINLGNERKSLFSTDRALAIRPKSATVYHLRSSINLRLGRIKDAIVDLQNALKINPNDVIALTRISLPLARQTRSHEALEVVQKAVDLAPTNVPARLRLAAQFVEMGKPEEGIYHYKAVLNIPRDNPAALEQLAFLLPDADVVALEPKIRTALGKATKNSEGRASLFYALAAVSDARKETAEADRILSLANNEMGHLNPYNADSDAAVTRAILARFPKLLKPKSEAVTACNPIFVIGLPRSGTTLVEAVLGAHPDVVPLGERGTLGFLLRESIENDRPMTPEAAAELVREDQRLLPELPKNAVAYVDKMPENYRLVGFLKRAYPNCKIINVRRDPRDIALSMWKSHFSGSVLSYAYDWDWMAAKFNLYAGSMAHWKCVLPDDILDVHYEELVGNIEGIGRRMAEFCTLEWHDAMARPDLSTEQVLTLSATQLRIPVHTGSIGKWRNKTDLLAPFVNGLDPKLWTDYFSV